jgi:serine/threonine-protein kinase HipA
MAAPQSLEVVIDLKGEPLLAGIAYFTIRRGMVTTFFEYAESYLADERSVDLSPYMRRSDRSTTTVGLPGVFADSAPDRWGRNLISRRLRAAARDAKTAPPTVTEFDFLCGVGDLTRQGALRFRARGEVNFLSEPTEIPRLVELPTLLAASRELASNSDDLAAIKLLLDAGSASLGGARPKASVVDNGRLAIAKFPHADDEWDVMAWEATALDLAARCGIAKPQHRLVKVSDLSVLLVDRFDRVGPAGGGSIEHMAHRTPYISAMTILDRTDGAESDYLEIAEMMRAHGSNSRQDLRELWGRIAFSVAVNNVDDHLRNHGFLHSGGGWSLSPLFDVNPHPDPSAHRVTGVCGETDRSGCIQSLLSSSETFGLSPVEARSLWSHIRASVADWRTVASANGISKGEQRLFADALDSVLRNDA